MKTLLTSSLIAMTLTSLPAHADYVGRYAKYVTTLQTGNSVEVQVGTSESKVISQDPVSHKYLIQVTNQTAQGVTTQKTHQFSVEELDNQKQGTLFHHCTDNYGTLSATPIVVKSNSFPACVIKSSNSEMDIGTVPFSVLKSISYGGHGKTYLTRLVDYQE